MQLSPYGLLLLTQPLHSSEQHTRANLEFSSNFGKTLGKPDYKITVKTTYGLKKGLLGA